METNDSVKTTTQNRQHALRTMARLLLGRSMGFGECLPQTLDQIVAGSKLHHLGKGETLIRTGQAFDCLGLVVEGSLENSRVRADGHRHLIHFLRPGDVAGLMCLVDGQPHSNDLTARVNETIVLVTPGSLIRELRPLDMQLGRAFELQLAFRSRLLYERLSADHSMPLEARLARLLLTLTQLHGHVRPDGILLDVKISQADLADWLGVSRQRVNLAIQQLKSEALINLSYSSILITDTTGLTARASH
jgi:CRP-like cAMP-binding protein